MTHLFLAVLRMSIAAACLVPVVLVLRFLFKRAPKWIPLVLWGIVALRLLCPFVPESRFSLVPYDPVVSLSTPTESVPDRFLFIGTVDAPVGLPAIEPETKPMQALPRPLLSVVWLVGMATMALYALVSYLAAKRRVATAVRLRKGIYQSEWVSVPFVLGLLRPKIYLPFHMCPEEMDHILAHEQAHIARRDPVWKLLGFLLLAVHWFNPLLWLSYWLLCRDIELACDEKVIRSLDHHGRAEYSQVLVNWATGRGGKMTSPLAFGEVGMKERVMAVLNYKKSGFWIVLTALVVCAAVAVCFLTRPAEPPKGGVEAMQYSEASLRHRYPQYFDLDTSNGVDVYVWQMSKGSYSFALLPHDEAHAGPHLNDAGAGPEEMRAILYYQGINPENSQIHLIVHQHTLSSYIGEYWIIGDGVDIEAAREAYHQRVWDMLFDQES